MGVCGARERKVERRAGQDDGGALRQGWRAGGADGEVWRVPDPHEQRLHLHHLGRQPQAPNLPCRASGPQGCRAVFRRLQHGLLQARGLRVGPQGELHGARALHRQPVLHVHHPRHRPQHVPVPHHVRLPQNRAQAQPAPQRRNPVALSARRQRRRAGWAARGRAVAAAARRGPSRRRHLPHLQLRKGHGGRRNRAVQRLPRRLREQRARARAPGVQPHVPRRVHRYVAPQQHHLPQLPHQPLRRARARRGRGGRQRRRGRRPERERRRRQRRRRFRDDGHVPEP
mmetsp:Transcript_10709/g.35110  ORF Transcript_10709/g.35110 Transcript_10709/m.35110 type:complete len:285 (+) Transcript_10709:1310-2164(+)